MNFSDQNTNYRRLGMYGALFLALGANLFAAEYFVSPDGSDAYPGSQSRPFASLRKAASVLQPGDTCYLRRGCYREILRPERSGEPGREIVFSNWKDEDVLLTGTDRLSDWREEGDGVWSAAAPGLDYRDIQVFVNGAMMSEACWPASGAKPLFHPIRAVASGGSDRTLVCEDIPGGDDAWVGARLWCAGGSAWICWSSEVTDYDAASHTLTFKDKQENWYTPQKGSLFSLKGLRRALHAPGQWFYESGRLLLIPPMGVAPNDALVEIKRRADVIDLSGRSHIRVRGLAFLGGGIRTDDQSSHITLEELIGRYVSHSNGGDVSEQSGVLIVGSHILVLSCDFGYSSSSVLRVKGADHRVINCLIHRGGYEGLWRGTVSLSGRRILFSHNTVRHAGRDLVNTHGLMESLLQYNDVSEAGWLTKDLGMFYGHNTDFANTVFRYNRVHDNHAEHCAMGIYFDHLSHNAIVHHNVVWNVGMDPIRFNNPSYNVLVYNNTCSNTGKVGTFDHSKREDLFASRYVNNIFNQPIDLPDHVFLSNNHVIEKPEFRAPGEMDFRLKEPVGDNVGAYAPDGQLWRAGCDLALPPSPLPVYEAPRIPWMNVVRNACFEFGSLEGWETTDAGQATLTKGNGWGNEHVGGQGFHQTGTSKFELRLGKDRDGVKQVIRGLSPHTDYTLSAWLRVSDAKETILLGVRGHGASEQRAESASTEWERKTIDFRTGPDATEAMVFIQKTTAEGGYGWADNLTLPLTAVGR